MKRIFTFVLSIVILGLVDSNPAIACLHFTESFTSPAIPTTYTTGNYTLSSGTWELLQIRGNDLVSQHYGGTGGSARFAKGTTTTASLISPTVNTVGTISFYYRAMNLGSGTFKVQKSINGAAFTDIATGTFNSQTYTLFTITINDASNNIRIKILSQNNSENLFVDEINITNYDVTAPMVTAAAQTITNTGQSALVQSNEAEGYVYIIKEGVAQTTVADLNNAVSNLQGAKTAVTAANTDISISALNLQIGNYHAYAVDCSNNISAMGSNIIQVVNSTIAITDVAFANGNYIIDDVINITITSNGTGYTAGTMTVNGHTPTGFTDNGNNTYSITYTVVEGDADAAQTSDVPFSVVLMDGANPSSSYTGPASGTITIDANRPVINSSQRVTNTQIKLTANELLNASTITQSNNGGFVVTDAVNTGTQYTVTSVNPGTSNSEIILTVQDFAVSNLNGLSIQYTAGGNGTVEDAAGNYMMTTYAIPDISPWSGNAVVNGLVFTTGDYKIGDAVTATIQSNAAGYTAGTITINGHAVTGFIDNGNNTYSVTYTVVEGDADAAQASDIPVSVVLIDGASPSSTFTGPASGTITVDAHRPLITASDRVSDTQIKITTNELLDAATITKLNDGGFVVTDFANGTIQYTVTAVNPGSANNEIILTVNDFSGSALVGLNIDYSAGGNGTVADEHGNTMATNSTIPAVDAWTGVGICAESDLINDFIIYPNPATDFISCSINSTVAENLELVLFNLNGQIVLNRTFTASTGLTTLLIDIRVLSSGVYYLSLMNATGAYFERKQLIVD